MAKMIIEVNKECGNTTAANLLSDLGYKYEQDGESTHFLKDGKKYKFVSWNHFNGYVYDIALKEVK
ncbi:hypothetical protein [Sporomusa sphaeroides]|uniref:hypothetical protein n=1 Tax=Sporomusa sphaeroides TaxID=47679 RepID=UPI002BC48D61|nr:hypothetical protein [Sporomusa sphaeroides]HML33839.1 hypothetical protein [Sporomusa sphaeroides]